MREIALDTETTGLSFADGDRIVEIGCIEIIDKKITDNEFHVYINPEREMSKQASEISGLQDDFLKDCPKFAEIADNFLDFISDSRLVIHNAPFDVGFLNFELQKANKQIINPKNVVDTLTMAKGKFPGSQATLDALCRRFNVDASSRIKHGALIDADLLAKVYIQMSVEIRQKNIFGNVNTSSNTTQQDTFEKKQYEPRKFAIPENELAEHTEFLKKIKNPIWNEYKDEYKHE